MEASTSNDPDVKTFRGRSLEEILPQNREELGPDAIVLRRREGLTGGVGGFFQRPYIEVDARPPIGDEQALEIRSDRATAEGLVIHAPVQPRHGVIPDAIRKLDSVGVAVDDIVLHRPTLDDVFIALTGHAAEDTTGAPEEEKEVAAA